MAAGEALLAIDNPAGTHPGAGATISLLLVTLASVLRAVAMVRSAVFRPAAGYLKLVAELTQMMICAQAVPRPPAIHVRSFPPMHPKPIVFVEPVKEVG